VAGIVVYGDQEADPDEIAALSAVSPARDLYFAGAYNDANWWTGIALVNPDPSVSANVSLTYWTPEGTPVDVVSQSVGPLAKIVGFTDGLFDLGSVAQGWVEARSTLPIVGVEVIHADDSTAEAWGLAGIEAQPTGNNLFMPQHVASSVWWTLFALANPDDVLSAQPTLSAWGDDGILQAVAEPLIPANGSVSGRIEDLFGF
jgi:hypothetical protein